MEIKLIEEAISDIEGKHSYYFEILVKMSKFPLWQQIRIKDLKPSRGIIQRAYNEIDKEKFEGNLIDYLFWISFSYIFTKLIILVPIGHVGQKTAKRIFNTFAMDKFNALRLFVRDESYIDRAFDKFTIINDQFYKDGLINLFSALFQDTLNHYFPFKQDTLDHYFTSFKNQ